MPLLIDVYNVLHAALGPAGSGRDLGLAGLARLLGESRFASEPATLVCDGKRDVGIGTQSPLVRVVFAGHGQDADTRIEGLIAADSAPRRLLVVSSDRRILAAARRRRAQVLTSEAFLSRVLADAARPVPVLGPTPRDRVPLSAVEVARWMADFGERASWAASLPAAPDPSAPVPVARRGTPSAKQNGPAPAPPHPPRPSPFHPASPKGPPVEPPAEPLSQSWRSDPLLQEAIERFGNMSWDDLDMARWLDAHATPNPDPRDLDS